MKKIILLGLYLVGVSYLSAQINTTIVTSPKPTIAVPVKPVNVALTDINQDAKNLKHANKSVDQAATELKAKYNPKVDKLYQALVAGGYDSLSSGKSAATLYQLSAQATFLNIPTVYSVSAAPNRGSLNQRIRILKHIHPSLTFEQITDFGNVEVGADIFFEEVCAALNLTNLQIVQRGVQYHNNRILKVSILGYPNPADVHAIVKRLRPSTNYFQLWAMLISNGYDPNLVFRQLPIGQFNGLGAPLDDVASCFNLINTTTIRRQEAMKDITLILSGDGTYAPILGQECYRLFVEKMKQNNVSRQIVKQLLESAVVCVPSGSSLCASATQNIVNQILTGANYPPDR